MTSEQKALELVNAVERDLGYSRHETINAFDRTLYAVNEALCRAIEAHEADKARNAAELREQADRFSEAVKAWKEEEIGDASLLVCEKLAAAFNRHLSPFILPPVDPLEECVDKMLRRFNLAPEAVADEAEWLRAALEARGLAIVKKETTNE